MIITKLVTNSWAFDIYDKNKEEVLKEIYNSGEYYQINKETTANYKGKICKDSITIYIKTDKMEILSIEEHNMEELSEEEQKKLFPKK